MVLDYYKYQATSHQHPIQGRTITGSTSENNATLDQDIDDCYVLRITPESPDRALSAKMTLDLTQERKTQNIS